MTPSVLFQRNKGEMKDKPYSSGVVKAAQEIEAPGAWHSREAERRAGEVPTRVLAQATSAKQNSGGGGSSYPWPPDTRPLTVRSQFPGPPCAWVSGFSFTSMVTRRDSTGASGVRGVK